MKKPDRGPDYRKDNGVVELREIKRPDLVKDPYRVRGRYTKEDGRPGTFDAMNWREALDRADKIKKALEEGRAALSKSPTFERVWKEWDTVREGDGLSPESRNSDKQIGRYMSEAFGKRRIDTIRPIEVEDFLKGLAKSKAAQARLGRMKVGQVFHFAKRKGYLTVNLLSDDPIKLPPREHVKPWVPDWDPMDRIIERGQGLRPAHATGYPRLGWSNMKTAIALSGGAGLRIGEVVAIPWDRGPGDKEPCVDFANGVLHVHWAFNSSGLGRPKKNKTRDVPMTQWVYDALLEHMHMLQSLGIKLEGPVIANRENPGRPVRRTQWSGNLRKFLVHAGVLESADQETEWHWHVLRRFYISARFALGHRQLDIMEAVAHSSADVTFKHYARALSEPTPIWRYRFRPAEIDDQTRVIHGTAVVVDGMVQLSAPPEIDGSEGIPALAADARRLLNGGWKVGQVAGHLQCSRDHLSRTFKKLGWAPPLDIYRAALHRKFKELSDAGVPPVDIATRTGTHVSAYHQWRQAHEAGVPAGRKSLETLRKSTRSRGPVTTDRKQAQLSLL